MQLQVQYQQSVQRNATAVFLRGPSLEDWLRIINGWEIPLSTLNCYPLPASRQSLKPAGLLVLFKSGSIPEAAQLLPAYGLHSTKLCLPIHASLHPSLSDAELDHLLLYDFQVIHPSIGLVGFAYSDQLDFGKYLLRSPQQQVDWERAHPGLPPRPVLQYIRMVQPPPQELLKELGKEIDQKPLEDIPGLEKGNSESLASKIQRAALRRALGLSDKLNDALDALPEGSSSGNAGGAGASPGLLDRFDSWARRRLENIENQRDKEIRRLMDLFKDNPEEALRYALPLDGQYEGRGKAPPAGRLSRRNADFNLGKLGGGQRVDGWDLGDRYFKLREMYNATAKEMIKNQQHRKAAYIYAQLLGDFHAAANVLKQGQYYREAAALYLEHLDDKEAAADCLEQGGLIFEAIELYSELGRAEYVGDLYQRMGNQQKAIDAFQEAVDQKLEATDYLEAARIYTHKLAQPGLAKDALLQGWRETAKAESCLIRYFNLFKEQDELHIGIQQIYDKQTPGYRKNNFLNVLLQLNNTSTTKEVQDTSRNIAYEIISEQAVKGKKEQLHQLRHFLPTDKLIYSDLNRYIAQHPANKPVINLQKHFAPTKHLQLDPQIKWSAAINGYDGWLAVGTYRGHLQIARCDWKGHVEITVLDDRKFNDHRVFFIASPHLTNHLFLDSLEGERFENKRLKAGNHFFKDIQIQSQYFLPENHIGSTIHSSKGLAVLMNRGGSIQLNEYSLEGDLLSTYDTNLKAAFNHLPANSWNRRLNVLYRMGHYYVLDQNQLLRFSKLGFTEQLQLNRIPRRMYTSPPNTAFRLIVETEEGCMYFRPTTKEFRPIGDFFADDIKAIGMIFIDEGLAIAGQNQVHIYDISNRQTTPELTESIKVEGTIIAILPIPYRKGFGLLFGNGKMTIYQASSL